MKKWIVIYIVLAYQYAFTALFNLQNESRFIVHAIYFDSKIGIVSDSTLHIFKENGEFIVSFDLPFMPRSIFKCSSIDDDLCIVDFNETKLCTITETIVKCKKFASLSDYFEIRGNEISDLYHHFKNFGSMYVDDDEYKRTRFGYVQNIILNNDTAMFLYWSAVAKINIKTKNIVQVSPLCGGLLQAYSINEFTQKGNVISRLGFSKNSTYMLANIFNKCSKNIYLPVPDACDAYTYAVDVKGRLVQFQFNNLTVVNNVLNEF